MSAAFFAVTPTISYASNDVDSVNTCSYRDAEFNDGWGFDHATGRSCAPRPSSGVDHLVLQLKGTGTAVVTDYDTDGDGIVDTTAPCFDAAVYDPASGKQIGSGSDCLDVQSNDEGNIRLTGTGFLDLEGGTLVVQGLTTVRPVLQTTTRGVSSLPKSPVQTATVEYSTVPAATRAPPEWFDCRGRSICRGSIQMERSISTAF